MEAFQMVRKPSKLGIMVERRNLLPTLVRCQSKDNLSLVVVRGTRDDVLGVSAPPGLRKSPSLAEEQETECVEKSESPTITRSAPATL